MAEMTTRKQPMAIVESITVTSNLTTIAVRTSSPLPSGLLTMDAPWSEAMISEPLRKAMTDKTPLMINGAESLPDVPPPGRWVVLQVPGPMASARFRARSFVSGPYG